jgi:hypothetical protein
MHPLRRDIAAAVLLALGASPAAAQFSDVTQASGLRRFSATWGAVMADLDDDGRLEILSGQHTTQPVIFWNQGTTFAWFLHPQPWTGALDRHGALVLPLLSSSRPDILMTHGAGNGPEANELYRNDGGGSFASLVGAAGLDDPAARGRAASAADYDGDGWVDVWIGNAPKSSEPNGLFRQTSTGVFEDVAPAVGLAHTLGAVGALWADYDDDGDPDLLVGGEEFGTPTTLHRNDGGTFVGASSLFSPSLPVVSGADWGDIDGDGDLDLAVCEGNVGLFDVVSEGDSLTFYFNTRWGEDGVDGTQFSSPGPASDTLWTELYYRGQLDTSLIYLGPGSVHPSGAGPYPLTNAYVGAPSITPGSTLGIFVWRTHPTGNWFLACSTPNSNLDEFHGWFARDTPISGAISFNLESPGFTAGGPRVWRNDGTGFVEISAVMGLPAALLNPRDVSVIDYDNDGDLDLHLMDMGTSAFPNETDVMYRNDGGVFTEVAAAENLLGPTTGLADGAVWGDVDNDGDLDVFLQDGSGPAVFSVFAPNHFLRNDGPRGASIQLDLRGNPPAVHAVGAKVTAYVGATRATRWVNANSWRGFQDPLRVHLGIGEAAAADSILIRWPSGTLQRLAGVTPGIYQIQEGVTAVTLIAVATESWRVLGPWPQPGRAMQSVQILAPATEVVAATVYDVSGRVIRTLRSSTHAPGETRLDWDGRDSLGQPVASGVYLLRVTDGQRSATVRSVRIR